MDENTTTYFGGKIKNPKQAYVYFLKDDKVIDSAKIKPNKRFLFTFDSIKEGLYTFKNGAEFQYLFLEPKDSIMIYLNTWNFDETLIFSGKGAEKNNFLLEVFLKQEKIEHNFWNYYGLDQDEFCAKTEEELKPLQTKYEKMVSRKDFKLSELFQKLAAVSIYYPFYSRKEFYPIKHHDQRNRHDYPKVSDDFYAFRENVDLNDKSLISFRSYTYYIESFLYNIAYQKGKENTKSHNFSLRFMEAVNENISDPALKSKYLVSGFWGSLKNNLPQARLKAVQEYFFKNCKDEIYIAEARNALQQYKKLKKGDPLPKLLIFDSKGNKADLHQIIRDKDAVIYFWPSEISKKETLLKSLHFYENEYPNVLFIGIERVQDNKKWQKFLNSKNLKKDEQFKLDSNCEAYSWFDSEAGRTLIIDNKGKIQNPFLFFSDTYDLKRNLHQLKKQ
jgi:peroxiredoxin